MSKIFTKKELEESINLDIEKTILDITECIDLYLKGQKLLSENKINKKDLDVINESLWEKVKYGLSKLGRYKAGGKILGKGKIDQEAGAKIQSIIDKKGNELIKSLNNQIKKENPKFPNNEKGDQFLKTVMEIAAVYDSIVTATKKNPKEEGYLPTDAANGIIADLAEYVKKFLDVDLAGAYTVMDSEEEKVKDKDDEKNDKDGDEELLTDEIEDINEDEAADVRAKLQAKKGDGKEVETERMKGLKSNKLPMTLAGVGASLGAFSWLVNTEWFKSLFETVTNTSSVEVIQQTVQTKAEVFSNIKPGQGMTQIMNVVNNAQPSSLESIKMLSPNSSPEDFLEGVRKLGGNNLKAGIDALAENGGIFKDPDAARDVLNEIAKNPHGHGDTLGEIFKDKWAGTGKSMGDALVTVEGGTLKGLIVKTIVKAIPTIITKTTVKIGAGYAIAKGFASVLGPIGIGLVAAGALVKIMRVKGQKQSRAKTLQDLLNSLQPVKASEASLPPVLPPKPKEEGEGGGSKGDDKIFNDLAGFFKYVYNNRKTISPENFGDKEEGSPKEDIKVGEEYFFTNKKGQKDVVKVVSLKNQVRAGGDKTFGTDDDITGVSIPEDSVWVTKATGRSGGKNTYSAKAYLADKSKLKKENVMKKENILTEVKFIKDPQVIKILKQKSGIDANKLKFFDEFLRRLEYIRNKVNKMGKSDDEVLNKFVNNLKSNPIMQKDFTKTFSVRPENEQNVENMGNFINDILEVIYSGNFRGKKFSDIGGMIKKMGTLGGGNVNKVQESYLIERKGKKAKAKGDFKNHMISFISELMNMFQYLYKVKKYGKTEKPENKQNKENKKTKKVKQESHKKDNPLLTEEINKIKGLMFKLK